MNFFDHQDNRRRHSNWLLLAFILALLVMAFVIHLSVALFSMLLGESNSLFTLSTPAIGLIGIVWLTVLAGCFFRALDVRAGGEVLARRFGATLAADRSRFEAEKQFLNIVAEMAIASRTPQPAAYVMRNESSINAFVVGMHSGELAIVVTQGALDAFDRDELQSVVAHEFGHIASGDLPLSMRLLIALGGLMAIDEVGRLLLYKSPDLRFHPAMIVGYLLRGFGSIGVFAGRMIRSAFSRQREYLADASAVQFTRNPYAMASALALVRDADEKVPLHSLHAEELAHICFQSGDVRNFFTRLFATHPPLQKRIHAIEPHFDVKQRQVFRDKEKFQKFRSNASNSIAGAHLLSGSAGESNGGLPLTALTDQDAHQIITMDVNETILSDRVLLMLPDESSCLAAIFAAFAPAEAFRRHAFLSSLAFSFDQSFADRVKESIRSLKCELSEDKLAILDHCAGILTSEINVDNRRLIMLKLERLLATDDQYDLMSYATLQLLRRKLDVEFPIMETLADESGRCAEARRAKNFDSMGEEFALLLSLMVETSGAPSEELEIQFKRLLTCYTQNEYPRRTASETGIVKELEAAFQTLYVQPKPIRLAFVQHCVEIIRSDGHIARAEAALLELFAASLGCEEMTRLAA